MNNNHPSPNWLDILNWLVSVFALSGALFSLYWQFFRKSKLNILYEDEPPYRLMLQAKEFERIADWDIRIKIQNTRRIIAKNCFGKIIEWYTARKRVYEFDPYKLFWVSDISQRGSEVNLSYQEYDYLNVLNTRREQRYFLVIGNERRFDFDVEHVFKLAVYCANEVAKFKYFKIYYQEDDPEWKWRFLRIMEIDEEEVKKYIE